MKAECKFSESSGKTIDKVKYHNGKAIIAFTDQTFAVISVDRGWGEGESEVCDYEFEWTDFSQQVLEELGIMSKEEHDNLKNRLLQKRNESELRYERQQYERLKAKFEAKEM